ncbi:MAG: hypothetical protein WC441_04110 [Patescibacteria group bacterium]
MTKISLPFYKVVWVLFYLLVFVFLLQHSFSYLDPDFGWHLRLGQEIASTGKVPTINYSNYTLEGFSWVDHEWLSNLTIYYVYNNLGYLTLNLFFCFIPLIVLFILNNFLNNYFNISLKKYLWPLILFESLSLVAVAPHLGVRIQEITWLFFVLLLVIILNYSKYRKWLVLWWLLPLFYLWANLHGGFLLGLGILFMFIGLKVFERLVINQKALSFLDRTTVFSWLEILMFVAFLLLAWVSTLLGPYGLSLYDFLSSYGNTFYFNHISEWLPQWAFPYQYWQFTYISVSLLAIYFWTRKILKKKEIKLDLFAGLMFLFFLVLAIKSRRHFPLFFIVSFPLLFKLFISDILPVWKTKEERLTLKNRGLDIFIKFFIISTFLVVTANLALGIKFTQDPFQNFCEDKYRPGRRQFLYPCQALAFIKSEPLFKNQRLFNDFGWGGYLLWRYPEKQLFIDGRMPQADFKGRSILEEYFDFFDQDKLVDKLEEYNIDLVLSRNPVGRLHLNAFEKSFMMINEDEINKDNELLDFLASSSDWTLVYSDSVSLLYHRNEKNSNKE